MAIVRNVVMPLVLATGVLTVLGGCKFFDLSNPFIPTARLYAKPSTSTMIKIAYNYKTTDNTIDAQVEESDIEIDSYPGDGTPGVLITSYSAQYLDESGKEIPTFTLSKVNFGVSQYVPPANGNAASSAKLQLPIYNQQVLLYGQNQVFDTAGGIHLNESLIHTINCSVTLYGQDDNFNQVTIPVSMPIRFEGKITH